MKRIAVAASLAALAGINTSGNRLQTLSRKVAGVDVTPAFPQVLYGN